LSDLLAAFNNRRNWELIADRTLGDRIDAKQPFETKCDQATKPFRIPAGFLDGQLGSNQRRRRDAASSAKYQLLVKMKNRPPC
jgi:hypothetical protein